jgi:hypothetical protein
MPSSILNSDDGVISGTSGLKSSGGDDGVLVFQSKGTETARINTDKQIVAAAGTASLPALTTTGDVNTGIFFSAADTVDITTAGVAQAQINSTGDFAINAGFGSVGKAYLCRAWVNFNGTGTPAIRESGNVSSITDNGAGDYTVNFTTAMPDANFALSGGIQLDANGTDNIATPQLLSVSRTVAMSSGSVRIITARADNGGANDVLAALVSIFR